MQLTNQHYSSKDLYTMALAQMHSFGLEKRIGQVQMDTLYRILKSTSAGNFHIKKLYTIQYDVTVSKETINEKREREKEKKKERERKKERKRTISNACRIQWKISMMKNVRHVTILMN